MAESRRGFLAKLGVIATAPVLTAFVPDVAPSIIPDPSVATGQARPGGDLVTARDIPEALVISSRLGAAPFHAGDLIRMPNAHLPLWIDGQRYFIPVYRG